MRRRNEEDQIKKLHWKESSLHTGAGFFPPLFSIYHDETQGEVSVWLNPQVLQEGKRKNTDSEYSGGLA